MMTKHERQWIDAADYEALLRKIRDEPINSPWMTGETGQYLFQRYHRCKSLLSSAEAVRISKKVGWRDSKI